MPNASLRAWNGTMPVPRIDVLAQDLLGVRRRDLLDVHAAGGAGDDDRARRGAIDDDAEVELALDLQPFLDQHAADLLALRGRSGG